MKRAIILVLISTSLYSYSQVGINTVNPQGVFHIDAGKDNSTTGTPDIDAQANDVSVSILGNIGVGTISPNAKIDLVGTSTITPIRARNIGVSSTSALVDKTTLHPVVIDNDGVIVKQFSPVSLGNSYYLDGSFSIPIGGGPVDVFTGINENTVVAFKFATNLSFGSGSRAMIYGQISFSVRNGFRVANDWTSSGNASTESMSLVGENTDTLVFYAPTQARLTFTYLSGIINVNSSATVTQTNVLIYEGKKLR